jgi:hypothetical protein
VSENELSPERHIINLQEIIKADKNSNHLTRISKSDQILKLIPLNGWIKRRR